MRGWAAVLLCALAAGAGAKGPSKGLPPAKTETIIPISAVAGDKKAFDGKEFCISGKASTIFKKYSRKGNHYYTVWLTEGGAKLKVFGFGFPDFKEGDALEACGKFTQEKWVSGRVFYDELASRSVRRAGPSKSGDAGVEVSSGPGKALSPPK